MKPYPIAERGLSLVEVLVVIGVLGILAALAIPTITDTTDGSKEAVGTNLVETLNEGLLKYSQIEHTITLAADNSSGADELKVLRSLQWRDSTNPVSGSPFVNNRWDPTVSDDTDDHRLVWNGRTFQMIKPGVAGTGLKVMFDASDLKTTVVDHGSNYSPL